jgi:hypothetical protein|nr:MAG TPA: hypothetical protein [Caudoviricetes sp.]
MEYGKKIQVGNFTLLKYKREDFSYLKVATVAGNWAMEYREDTMVFVQVDMSEDDKEMLDALSVIFTNAMACASIVDATFQHSVVVAIDEFINRPTEELSDEEDAKILEEERMAHEIKDEAENEQKGKADTYSWVEPNEKEQGNNEGAN